MSLLNVMVLYAQKELGLTSCIFEKPRTCSTMVYLSLKLTLFLAAVAGYNRWSVTTAGNIKILTRRVVRCREPQL